MNLRVVVYALVVYTLTCQIWIMGKYLFNSIRMHSHVYYIETLVPMFFSIMCLCLYINFPIRLLSICRKTYVILILTLLFIYSFICRFFDFLYCTFTQRKGQEVEFYCAYFISTIITLYCMLTVVRRMYKYYSQSKKEKGNE